MFGLYAGTLIFKCPHFHLPILYTKQHIVIAYRYFCVCVYISIYIYIYIYIYIDMYACMYVFETMWILIVVLLQWLPTEKGI